MIANARGYTSYRNELISDLSNQFQEMFVRHVELAFNLKQMDEVTYRRFMSETCGATNENEVFEHYQSLYAQLKDYLRDHLLDRIVKGASFIDSVKKDDPRHEPAMKRYDVLCEELSSYDERERSA